MKNLFSSPRSYLAAGSVVLAFAIQSPTSASAQNAFNRMDVVTPTNIVGTLDTFHPVEVPPSNLGAFNIVINAGSGLSGNAPALAAFERAAAQWEAFFTDPITVNINANLAALGAGIIGSTSSVFLQAGYNTVRNQLVADAADEPGNAIVAFLPTAAQFTAFLPSGRSLDGFVAGTKANLKAAGFTGLDAQFGANDADITFSTSFAFDFDNSNGVTGTDFETVAAHEIGHALGFVSIVDSINEGQTAVQPTTLDLFRFGRVSGNPTNAAQFTSNSRNLIPGADTITDDTTTEYRMSSGLNTAEFPAGAGTDGRQASHWKADELVGPNIGIMDPTLSTGVATPVKASDVRAMDLIGYDVVPEPTTVVFWGVALVCFGLTRRTGRRTA